MLAKRGGSANTMYDDQGTHWFLVGKGETDKKHGNYVIIGEYIGAAMESSTTNKTKKPCKEWVKLLPGFLLEPCWTFLGLDFVKKVRLKCVDEVQQSCKQQVLNPCQP